MTQFSHFDISVVDYPEKRLAGFRIRTTIPAASCDCPLLWKKFHAVADRLPGWKHKKFYGLFLKTDQYVSLDFSTLAEITPDDSLPESMEICQLSGGKYVHCLIPTAADILMAYHAVYSDWLATQDEYIIDMAGECFELYPPQWNPQDAFDLFVKLKKRGNTGIADNGDAERICLRE